MKYILFMMLFATSCGSIHDQNNKLPSSEGDFEIITVDGCQYLYRAVGYKGFLAHKGNCNQCVERQKQVCQVNKHIQHLNTPYNQEQP